MCISDRPDEYTGKAGLVKSQIITVADQEPGVNTLSHTLEYQMSEEEKAKFAGKVQFKTVTLGIRELVSWGGKIRARGAIVAVEGLK